MLPEERIQASQKRPPKPPLEERLQASWKRPRKPPLEERLQASRKRAPKPPLEERLKCAPLQEGEQEDVQASWKRPPKPPLEERMKSPAPQEKSKQCSWWRWLIMEEDDEMFPCNIEPFSEDIQASWKRPPKPPLEERMKSPAPQEKSKQSSWRWQFVMEENDEMFPCNIDPFAEELVY